MEEFADYGSMKDSVFVRIANIPLQESIRDLRCGCQQQQMLVIEAQCGKSMLVCDAHFAKARSCAIRLMPCRHFHLNQLVRVDGVVTRRTGVYPQLQASQLPHSWVWLAGGGLVARLTTRTAARRQRTSDSLLIWTDVCTS